MSTISPSDTKRLRSWDAGRQTAYRQTHPDEFCAFHVLLDASPSMLEHADALVAAWNRYLAFLKTAAPPMSVAEVRCFGQDCPPSPLQGLGTLAPLRRTTYRPEDGNGTALYNAVGTVCSTAVPAGLHLLIVCTDGEDCDTDPDPRWTAARVQTLLTTLQDEAGWLCVFLGTGTAALTEAHAMGFPPGNCRLFASDQWPEAFAQLREATQRYLLASPPARKLLAAGGVF